MRSAIRLALIVASLAGVSSSVVAGGHVGPRQPGAVAATRAPLKDCTRIVGRYGYYGNPWCNAAEQRAFDSWEARRLGALRSR